MRRKHRPKRQVKPHNTFHGNAGAMLSATAAKAVYDTLIKRLLDRDPENWSLVSGFFSRKAVIAFLWEPSFDREMVATVERTVTIADGAELGEPAKGTLLAQLLCPSPRLGSARAFRDACSSPPQG